MSSSSLCFLSPVIIGTTLFHDYRAPDPAFDLEAGHALYNRVLNSRMDTKREFLGGEDPGCDEVRNRVVLEDYRAHRRSGGTLTYSQFEQQQKTARACTDPTTPEAFLWLAFDRDGSQGGIGFYNIELLGPVSRQDPTIQFAAMISPMTVDPTLVASFMRRMLDGPLPGFDDMGVPTDFQMVQWRFPTTEHRNRWYRSGLHVEDYLSDIGPHTLLTSTEDGLTFPTVMNRVAP